MGRLLYRHGLRLWRRHDRAIFGRRLHHQRQGGNAEEIAAHMMCVVGIGHDQSLGQFRFGGQGETTWRQTASVLGTLSCAGSCCNISVCAADFRIHTGHPLHNVLI
jgi:hypothetical protein